ncbi:hypothetical protein [Flavobacterium pedocola]
MKNIYFLLLLFCISAANAQTKWKTFTAQYGVSVELPDYFSKGILVAGGTLQWFNNKVNKDFELTIESFGNGSGKDLEETYKNDLKNEKNIVYKVKRNTWYVISGKNEDGIYYHKSIIKNGIQFHLRIIYPEKDKQFAESIIGRISTSFK